MQADATAHLSEHPAAARPRHRRPRWPSIDATRAIAGVLDIDAVLQLIVDRVRPLVGAATPRSESSTRTGGSSGSSRAGSATRTASGSARPARSRPARPDHPRGPVLPDRRTSPPTATHRASRRTTRRCARSSVCRSSSTGGRSGNLYLTDKLGAAEFSAEDERLVEMFALHAGIAHRQRAPPRAGPAARDRRRARADQPGPARRHHPERSMRSACRSRTCRA